MRLATEGSRPGPPIGVHYDDWAARIGQAANAGEVIEILRAYLSAWTPEQLLTLPRDLASVDIIDAEQLAVRALVASQAELRTSQDHEAYPLIREMARTLTAAAMRIGHIESTPVSQRETDGLDRIGPHAMRYAFSMTSDYLRAELVGRNTAAENEEFIHALIAKAQELQCTRILICVRKSSPIFQVEKYHLSGYLQRVIADPRARIALVADSSEVRAAHEYVEALASQRGANVRSYMSEGQAAGWLRAEAEALGQ